MQTNQTKHELLIESIQLKKAALILRAINHPLRQQMLRLLHRRKRMAVTEIYSKLKLEQSLASQQLAILRKNGFVNTKREGKQIFYSVNYAKLKEVSILVKDLISYN